MNKDVIYIEPEDDITDIITKIEKAKNKIVALVPPKKAGVFRSIVNIKLIAKTGVTAEKTIVLVTADPSITKLAAAAKIPVTENLQSAPSIPTAEGEAEVEVAETEITTDESEQPAEDETDGESAEEKRPKEVEEADEADLAAAKAASQSEEDSDDKEEDREEDEDTPSDSKSTKKDKSKASGVAGWIKDHKKIVIFLSIFVVGLIVFLIWAFGFAPAVDINVAIKTEQKNFSENVTFVTEAKDVDVDAGRLYLEERTNEEVKEVSFTATGQKNIGDKATGELIVYTYFKENGAIPIAAGSAFTISGLSFTANESLVLQWDGKDWSVCENKSITVKEALDVGCLISGRVKVTAAQSGEKYNIDASESNWSAPVLASQVVVYSDKPMTGGTDKIITVVQQSDVEKAKDSLATSSEAVNKAKLLNSIGSDYLVIEDTFTQETKIATPSPAVDAEVPEGQTPTLKATTTTSVFILDKVKLEEFIREKAKLEDGQRIYQIQDVYTDNFIKTDGGYTAKLKATYFIGPKITESELVSKILGKGLGDARREISDIYGVSEVTMEPSYPWVMAVPGDSNKVKITFEVKDQNGNTVNYTTDNATQNTTSEADTSTSEAKSSEN